MASEQEGGTPFRDWRERLVEINARRLEQLRGPEYELATAGAGRAHWKRDIVAAYLFDGDFSGDADAARFAGLLPAAGLVAKSLWAFVFGGSKTGGREGTFRIEDFDVAPDEAALIIRDGRILGVFHQSRVVRGGFVDWLKRQVEVHHRFRILMVNLAPIRQTVPVAGLITRDSEEVSGEVHLTVQAMIESLPDLLGLLGGTNLLLARDVTERVKTELQHRVLVPGVRGIEASALRTDPGTIAALEQTCLGSLGPTLAPLGIRLQSVTIAWERTAAEQRELDARQAALREAAKDTALDEDLAQVQRDSRLSRAEHEFRDMPALQQEVEKGRTEVELERLRAQKEAARTHLEQDRDDELARREMERRLAEKERTADLESRTMDSQVERTLRLKDAASRAKLEAIRAQADLTPEQILAIQSAETPAAAEALREKFRAEAARDTSAAERMQQMAERSAQNLQEQAVKFGDQMADVAKAAAGARPRDQAEPDPRCPSCGKVVQRDWRTCPFCAAQLGDVGTA